MSPLSRRWTNGLATFLVAIAAGVWIGGGLLSSLSQPTPPTALDIAWLFSFVLIPVVGWLIAVKQPQNPLGWILLCVSLAAGLGSMIEEIAVVQALAGNEGAAVLAQLTGSWIFGFGLMLLFIPGVLLFPTGQPPSPRWRWILWPPLIVYIASLPIEILGTAVVCIPDWTQEGDACLRSLANPYSTPVVESLKSILDPAVGVVLALATLASMAGLVLRYRRSTGEVRQQIKWVAFVVVAGVLPLILISMARELLDVTSYEMIDVILITAFQAGLPIAIGIAILKYRLYEIDRIISRTAAYATVVGLLTVVFLLSVLLTQRLLPIEGQFGIVVSTLVVAALFNPLRKRVLGIVDRRFNRSRYNAQKVLDEFAVQLREDVDLELMQTALLSAADDTMQPAYLSLWIRERVPSRE